MNLPRTISAVLALLCVLTLGPFASASHVEGDGQLQVTGHALLTAAPDTVHITLGVETSGALVEDAVQENANRMASVLEALKSLGLDVSDIHTSGYSIYSFSDMYSSGETGLPVTTYRVDNRVTITTKDLDQVGKIVDAAVLAGANQVQNVTFDLSHKEELQQRALQAAVEQAMIKARVMAQAAGETMGGIVSITEEYGTYVPRNESLQMMAVSYDRGAGTSINPGEIEVSAQVTMVFSF